LLLKVTSDPTGIYAVDPMFFRSMRKTFNCATLTGTAALAAFLASAGVPALAARHHHHSDSSSQSSSIGNDTASSDSSGHMRRHHHHHATDEQQASDTQPVTHHHHTDRSDSSEDASMTTPRRHHHHHDADNDTASAPTAHRHHHHHEDDSDTASAPSVHRHHHHHEDESDTASAPTIHRHHHHHEEDADSDSTPRRHHHHHEFSDQDASSSVTTEPRLSRRQQEAAAVKLMHDPSWLAHVARYEEHMAKIDRDHELRLDEIKAHEANVREANVALHSGNVVRAAEAFRGTPYVMGGTSRSGFDCSGFTRYIFGESAGVDLPRTAEEQYYTGEPISKDDLKAGDLVFFRDTYRHGISHVGMYIGDGRFVHACSPSRGVTVSSLSEQYYINHWAGARRVMSTRESSGL
jgi:cell wall-associated NlpC family hydrolase